MMAFMKRKKNKPEEKNPENDVSDELVKLIIDGKAKRDEIFGQKPRKKEDQ